MNTYYKNDLNRAYMILENEKGKEDYRVWMLKENRMQGILKMDLRYVDEKEQYYYDITGKKSVKEYYERARLGYEEMKEIIESVLLAVQSLKKHMIEGDGLLLHPKYIFYDKGEYFYCYYPRGEQSIAEAFHELTEFFVREVDYRDERGVHLAYVIHKATMEQHYSIEQILEDFFEEEPIEEISYDTTIEEVEVEQSMVAEKKDVWESVKKLFKSISCN